MSLSKAIEIAARVHDGQTDKADAPYILHCLAVMQAVAPDEDAMIVAVLHDVLEDHTLKGVHAVKLEHELRAFGPSINDSLKRLAHVPGERYDDYIERVSGDYLARIVKIADLTHNMDPRRIPAYQIVDKDFARWDKYRRALIRLERAQPDNCECGKGNSMGAPTHYGEEGQQLAIIREVTYGVDDRDRVSLMFTVFVTEGSCTYLWIQNPEAEQIIKDAGVRDVSKLNGKACWVDVSKPGIINFVKIASM